MKRTAWILPLALVTLGLAPVAPVAASAAPGSQTAAAQPKDNVEKTKDAVVKGAKVVGDKTMDGLSKTGEVMTDAWVTARVHGRFVSDDLLKDSDIKVDSEKHVVTLTGTVMTRAGRTKATTIAQRTEGVRKVVNRLTIGPKKAN